MKYTRFSKLVTFTMLILLILGISIETRNIFAGANSINSSNLNYSLHSSISVYSNQDLLDLGFPGNGSLQNPIIIEDLMIISVSDSSLLINNVSLNFIIRNCYFEAFHTAIGLTEITADYVEIYNNTIFDTLYGIRLSDSVQMNISSNSIYSCNDGVYAGNITNLKVRDSTVIDFEDDGIRVFDCFNITLENNNCETTDSSLYLSGIHVSNNNYTSLIGNNITNCDYNIDLEEYSTDITYNIEDNIVNANKLGFYYNTNNIYVDTAEYGQFLLHYCNNVTLKNQYIANVNLGIEILECNNVLIMENHFYKIDMFDCYSSFNTNINFTSNICEEGNTGIYVNQNENCTISSNVFLEIDKGICFSETMNTIVTDNSFTNSSIAFYVLPQDAYSEFSFENNTINSKSFGFFIDENSLTISNSDYGQIFIVNCSNVEIIDQSLSHVYDAIYILDSSEINIYDSEFNNTHCALYILRSSSIKINNCEFIENKGSIRFFDNSDIEIIQNNFFNNEYSAITSFLSSRLQIHLNLIHNSSNGIYFFGTSYGTITYNTIQYCRDYGIELLYGSNYNKIYSNNFVDNRLAFSGSQAYDEGYNNEWYDGANYQGNYWSNWEPISGNYYLIDGSAGSRDNHPNSMLIGEYSSEIWFSLFIPIVFIIMNFRKKRRIRR